MNEKNYMQLMYLFNDFCDNKTELTLFWKNGSILKGVSDIGYSETDSDIPEGSPDYPGYYSAFLKIKSIVFWDERDLEINYKYQYVEIDMLNAPMVVKVNDKIVWEQENE